MANIAHIVALSITFTGMSEWSVRRNVWIPPLSQTDVTHFMCEKVLGNRIQGRVHRLEWDGSYQVPSVLQDHQLLPSDLQSAALLKTYDIIRRQLLSILPKQMKGLNFWLRLHKSFHRPLLAEYLCSIYGHFLLGWLVGILSGFFFFSGTISRLLILLFHNKRKINTSVLKFKIIGLSLKMPHSLCAPSSDVCASSHRSAQPSALQEAPRKPTLLTSLRFSPQHLWSTFPWGLRTGSVRLMLREKTVKMGGLYLIYFTVTSNTQIIRLCGSVTNSVKIVSTDIHQIMSHIINTASPLQAIHLVGYFL